MKKRLSCSEFVLTQVKHIKYTNGVMIKGLYGDLKMQKAAISDCIQIEGKKKELKKNLEKESCT